MTKKEIQEIKQILIEVTNILSSSNFKNIELSRRERVKERCAYLLSKYEIISKDEQSELDYVKYLVNVYYINHPIN